jgi:hypothetical protein
MTRELVCPGCYRTLKVPDEPQAPALTCPSCLAAVRDPLATPASAPKDRDYRLDQARRAQKTLSCMGTAILLVFAGIILFLVVCGIVFDQALRNSH